MKAYTIFTLCRSYVSNIESIRWYSCNTNFIFNYNRHALLLQALRASPLLAPMDSPHACLPLMLATGVVPTTLLPLVLPKLLPRLASSEDIFFHANLLRFNNLFRTLSYLSFIVGTIGSK